MQQINRKIKRLKSKHANEPFCYLRDVYTPICLPITADLEQYLTWLPPTSFCKGADGCYLSAFRRFI